MAGAAGAVLGAVAASAVRADGSVPQAASGGKVAPQSPQTAPAPVRAAPGPAQGQTNSATSSVEPPPVNPSFIYAFGQWWDNTSAKLDDFAKPPDAAAHGAAQAAQDAMKGAAQVTRDAVDVLIRLPTARFIEVHARFAVAQNGAPDCRTAAAKVCHVKGFSMQSSQDRSPAVWMSGHPPPRVNVPNKPLS